MNRPLRQFRGFTLLELIVAMTMITIIAAALYSSLNAAVRGKRAAERAILPIRAASVAMNIIEHDLESTVIPNPLTLVPASLVTDTQPLYLAGSFQGTSQGSGSSSGAFLSFYTMGSDGTPDVPLSEGIRRIELATASDGAKPVLVRRIARNLLSEDVTAPAEEEEILCEDVRSFTVRFFDGVEWYEEWDSTQMVDINNVPAIPMLVQIDLVLNMEGVSQTGEEAGTYRVSKLIPLACAKPVDPDATATLAQTLP